MTVFFFWLKLTEQHNLQQALVVVVVACVAHTEPNYKADGYSSVDDVYEGQHKSSVSLALGTGVLQLSLTVLALRELTSHSS